ncbi:MAG TPA: hypothetical protein GXX28_01075 [Firmicutes bacterium]|nr:hypothetical protein [Bacillota bacterium]
MNLDLAKFVVQYQPAAFLILFVVLLWWVLDQNSKREAKLMEHSNKLLEGFQDLKQGLASVFTRLGNVEDEVKDIREKVG